MMDNPPPKARSAEARRADRPPTVNIIFFGTPEFGASILGRLIQSGYKPVLVVTQPDQPVGRKQVLTPPAVKVLAMQHQIPVLQPAKLGSEEAKKLKAVNGKLAIVAAYGKIIPEEVLDTPEYGTLNVHPSLLPRWRGPSPIQYSILHGDKKTGVTIMLLDKEVDHGPIVSSIEYQIPGTETAEGLSTRLGELGADLLLETIPKWIAGKIEPKDQDHSQATYSKILTREDGHIDWNKSAQEVKRQIRAFTPWPGSFTFWGDKRLKIISVHVSSSPGSTELSPGQTFIDQEGQLAVRTAQGILHIEKLQPEGRQESAAKAFLNGHPQIVGAILQ